MRVGRLLTYGAALAILAAVFEAGQIHNRWQLEAGGAGRQRLAAFLVQHPDVVLDNRSVQQAISKAYQARAEQAEIGVRRKVVNSYRGTLLTAPNTPFLGAKHGRLSLIEVTDYNCAPCRASTAAVEQALPVNPDLRVTLIYLPVYGMESELAARSAIAVFRESPQDFEKFHTALMSSNTTLSEQNITSIVKALGIDTRKFHDLLNDPVTIAELARMQKFTNDLKLNGVPAFLMGTRLVEGGVSAAQLQSLILDSISGK